MSVWIEISDIFNNLLKCQRHTLHECVDWNTLSMKSNKNRLPSHSTWVCGLKFLVNRLEPLFSASHTLHECVDWNTDLFHALCLHDGHTLHECVDWNVARWVCIALVESHTLHECVARYVLWFPCRDQSLILSRMNFSNHQVSFRFTHEWCVIGISNLCVRLLLWNN